MTADGVVLVTGGCRGIGAATAALLVEQGQRAVIADIAPEPLEGTGTILWPAPFDVASETAVVSGIADNAAGHGPITGLVNAAGIASGALNKELLQRPTAMNRLVEPIEVAQAIAWLLSPMSSGVTGINLPVDAGFIAGSTWAAYGGLRESPDP